MHVYSHSHTTPTAAGDSPRHRLALAFLLVSGFMGVEVAGGLISGSLALLADAGHMLTDSLALALSYVALWLGGKAATPRRTYGFMRVEGLVAFVNALGLLALAVWIVVEALERIAAPRPVLDGVLLGVALAGLGVNLLAWWLLHGLARENLNIRSALWHVLGDVLGSVGAIAAALVIRFTGWMAVDAMIGMGVAVLIAIGGGRILLEATRILLDAAPPHLDTREVRSFLEGRREVDQVCDLHVWNINSRQTMLTAHLVVGDAVDRDAFLQILLKELERRFGLAHMTVQLEGAPGETCVDDW